MAAVQQRRRAAGLTPIQQKELLDAHRIATDNARLRKRLGAIAKEPPAPYLAPAPPRVLPVPRAKAKKEEAWRIAHGNELLQKKLRDQYRPDRASEIVKKGWGLPMDGLQAWAKRLTLYDNPQPPLRDDNHVPREYSVVICSGCGRKSFFLADGPPVMRHPQLDGVFYCSGTCQELDVVCRQRDVEYVRTGTWADSRPPSQSWVVNSSMAFERKLLRRNAALERPLTGEEIRAKSAVVREREVAAERAEARRLHDILAGKG